MTTRQTKFQYEQAITPSTTDKSNTPENPDIFVVVHSHSSVETQPTPEVKREKFVSKRTKSLKDILFKHRAAERNLSSEPKLNQPTKSKIATLISKHFPPLRFRRRGDINREALSCPNIADRVNSSPDTNKRYSGVPKVEIKRTENSDSQLSGRGTPPSVTNSVKRQRDSDSISVKSANALESQLTKSPSGSTSSIEVFTTSFTHSAPKKTQDSLAIHILPRDQSRSAQDLQKSPLVVLKQKLVRSYSDTPPSKLLLKRKQRHYLTLDTFRQSRMYKDDHVSQLLDYLFIGSVEAAYNQPLLCKLKIDSIVDMSNISAAEVPASKKTLCPCLCAEQSRHFRSRLIINLEDDEREDIGQYFPEINKFIDGARQRGKKVLLFSYNGTSRAPAAAIQYLMSHENFLLRQAFNLVKNQRPSMSINQGFQKTLESVEHSLFPDEIPSVQFGNEYLNIADPQAIKCAWVDCSDM